MLREPMRGTGSWHSQVSRVELAALEGRCRVVFQRPPGGEDDLDGGDSCDVLLGGRCFLFWGEPGWLETLKARIQSRIAT